MQRDCLDCEHTDSLFIVRPKEAWPAYTKKKWNWIDELKEKKYINIYARRAPNGRCECCEDCVAPLRSAASHTSRARRAGSKIRRALTTEI